MSGRAPVLAVRRGGRERADALRALWREVIERGWIPAGVSHVAIRVSSAERSALAVETARALVACLVVSRPGARIDILDAGDLGEWAALRVRDLATEPAFRVVGIALPRGVAVPAAWFEPGLLVTIAGVGPDRDARITGALHAQAEVLAALGNPRDLEALVYEAHHLGGSDVSVDCGEQDGDWWAASPSDIAVDQAVAQAAGIDPERMPWLRALARHEIAPAIDVQGELPTLRAVPGSAAVARMRAIGRSAARSVRRLRGDAAALHRNLHKIPHAFARRFAALRRRWQAA